MAGIFFEPSLTIAGTNVVIGPIFLDSRYSVEGVGLFVRNLGLAALSGFELRLLSTRSGFVGLTVDNPGGVGLSTLGPGAGRYTTIFYPVDWIDFRASCPTSTSLEVTLVGNGPAHG